MKVLQSNLNNNAFWKTSRGKNLSEKARLTDSEKRINKILLIQWQHLDKSVPIFNRMKFSFALSFIFQYDYLVPKIQP